MSNQTDSDSPEFFSRGVKLALTATFFFSMMQIGVKFLHRLPSEEIVFFRALFLLLISFVIVKQKGLSPVGVNKPILLLRGVTGAIALILFFYTLQHVPLATAVTLQYLSPIFTILFAVVIMKEKATWKQWIAFLIAMGGVVMIKGLDPRVSLLHAGLGVLSALFSGLAYNFIRKLKDSDHPDVVVMYFPLITIPVVTPLLFGKWIWPTLEEWGIIVLVGISTQIAQMSMTRAYQMEKAADITIYKYTGLVYALGFGYFLFDESMSWLSILGMCMVVLAVYIGSRGKRAQRHVGPSTESWARPKKTGN